MVIVIAEMPVPCVIERIGGPKIPTGPFGLKRIIKVGVGTKPGGAFSGGGGANAITIGGKSVVGPVAVGGSVGGGICAAARSETVSGVSPSALSNEFRSYVP